MPEAKKSLSALDQFEHQQRMSIRRNRIWLLTYVSLFTSLLAFFVLIITLTELEGIAPKRAYQKIMTSLYDEVKQIQQRDGLDWMQVENTFSKGVRISIDPALFERAPLFEPARADLNPRFYPYLNELARVLEELDFNNFHRKYRRWITAIRSSGMVMDLTFRVEGHTDAIPLAPGARYRDNIELSTFRAYALMDYLSGRVDLKPRLYAIAGYGSFHPVTANPNDAENRRIELYIVPQMLDDTSEKNHANPNEVEP
jgi:chemotaxis protein MotB